MDRLPSARVWLGRGLYLGLAVALMFFRLMPLDTMPRSFALPDLLLVVTLMLALRRPHYLPAPLVALVFFASDLIFQKPPGLNAVLVLVAVEWLRQRENDLRSASLLAEWLHAGGAILAIAIATRVIMAVLMIPQAPLALTASEVALSFLAYPLLALMAEHLFGLGRQGAGEAVLGNRL